jgi:localization factor PodJL
MVAPSATSSMLAPDIEPRIEFETTGSVPDTKTKATSPSPTPHRPTELPPEIGTTGLRMAALAADPAAAFEIGRRWFDGQGVPADLAEAKRWFEIAYKEGSMPAAYRLGNMYEKGFGTPKDLAEARRYYTRAAEAGNIKAMHNLAVLAAEGADGKPDYKLAARWFRIASDHNVRDSQYNLGVLYARGAGVERNFAESYRWFALASAQGDTDAVKKRDEIAKHLDPQALATVKIAVREWKPTPSDEEANEVKPRPEWEKAMTPPPARKKTAKR